MSPQPRGVARAETSFGCGDGVQANMQRLSMLQEARNILSQHLASLYSLEVLLTL